MVLVEEAQPPSTSLVGVPYTSYPPPPPNPPAPTALYDPLRDVLASIPLSVDVLDLTAHINALQEKQLIQVAQSSQHIKTLVIKGWEEVKVAPLRTLAIRLGAHLLHVDLSGSHVQDTHLELFTTHLSGIRSISLQGCPLVTTTGIRPLVAACQTTLTSLNLSRSPKISSECLQWIGGTVGNLACGLLRVLDVSECRLVGDHGVASLARGCRALQYVNLSGCPLVSDLGASAMCIKLRYLKVLRVEGCPRLGDATIMAVGKGCPALRSLNASRCGPITDKGIITLARGCPRLQSLNIAGAKKVTEAGLCEIAKMCPGLQVLNVTGCEVVTANGMKALIQGLKYVREAKTFFGFVPKDTAILEKLEDVEYKLQEDAAILLQNGVLKRVYRRWGRQFLYRLFMSKYAIIIQRAFRRHVKRSMYLAKDHLVVCHKNATTVQRVYRGYVVRKLALAEIRRRKEYARLQSRAIPIQAIYRGFITRKKVGPRVIVAIHELLGQRREEMLSAAAVYIQTLGRTYLSCHRVAALLELCAQHRLDVRRSALPIQMCFRAFRARRVLSRLRWQKRYRDFVLNRAARAIQKWYLKALGSWEHLMDIRREAARKERERCASITIQRAVRGYLRRRELWLYLRSLMIQSKAALVIQKVYRSSCVMRYRDMRLNRLAAEIYDMQDMEHGISASKVQDLRTKLLASIRVVEESSDSVDDMEDEDNLWQELWDSENNCVYYYNSMLNETTYEVPESKNAFQMSLVGRTVKILWPAMGQWYEGTITRYNKTKKKHRVEYSDGDHEWIHINNEHDRVQILEGDSTWVMFNMYEPQDERERKALKQIKKKLREKREKLIMEDQEWVEMEEDKTAVGGTGEVEESQGSAADSTMSKPPVIRVINQRTGEIRIKSKEANMWDLSTDQDGHACFIHRRSKRVVYENPKYEALDALSPEQLAKEKSQCMEQVHYAAYFVSDFLEQYARTMTDKDRKVLFRRLDESSAVKNLAGALAKARGLWGNYEFDQDDYLIYANELLAQIQAVMLDKSQFTEKYVQARRKLLDVEKTSAVVICHQCGHEVERTKKYCPTCGTKMLFYRMMPDAIGSDVSGGSASPHPPLLGSEDS